MNDASETVVLALGTPEGLAQFQVAESKKWGEVIRAAGIEAQ